MTFPEGGGPVTAYITAVLASDAGANMSYQIGHDSRAGYSPPDPRAPENYIGWSAGDAVISGTVGVSIEGFEAGETHVIGEPEYESSTFDAVYDPATQTLTGTVVHLESVVTFVADDLTVADAAVFPTPECFPGGSTGGDRARQPLIRQPGGDDRLEVGTHHQPCILLLRSSRSSSRLPGGRPACV